MKALSLRPEWAMPVFLNAKKIEHRTWKTDYRGPLLICSSSKKTPATIAGKALCVVDLVDIEPYNHSKHADAACLDEFMAHEVPEGYAWHFENCYWIEPFDQKGKLHLFDVDDSQINYLPENMTFKDAYYEYFDQLMYYGRDKYLPVEWHEYIDSIL